MADAKVFEHFKTQGLAVLTANTFQVEDAFFDIDWIPLNKILEQLDQLLARYSIRHVKIGLIESSEALQAILTRFGEMPHTVQVCWDPILKATAGGEFDTKRFTSDFNLPENVCLLVTPNFEEYEVLEPTLKKLQCSIYLKGGDSELSRGIDYLMTENDKKTLLPRITTNKTKHGSGCMFSSSVIAHLAKGYPLLKACFRSKRFVEKALLSNDTFLASIRH